MKSIILFFAISSVAAWSFGQSTANYIEVARQVLKTEKKEAVAEALQLSEAESGPFWLLYNEYNTELY